METIIKTFEELNTIELFDIAKARMDVFVVEQNCPYQDLDEIDKHCLHVFIKNDNALVAYARVFIKDKASNTVQIGRVLTTKRKCGYGTMVMEASIQAAIEKLNAKGICLAAQCYAIPFYEKFGFKITSEEFLEDNIPHKYMSKTILQ